jgi:hypothetical protein
VILSRIKKHNYSLTCIIAVANTVLIDTIFVPAPDNKTGLYMVKYGIIVLLPVVTPTTNDPLIV